ncbi:hypothetical protein FRX31_029521 [Thalictrum thalictroides]|uniref:Uncharacterized protein n=1 Tax=Thalictrum thalictroides TaxID=46969 RepID=A0A7J6V8G3_THATH|nr:hypothetical protein FRX31_029521 [Thalictrum thalictroides]
MILRVAAQKPTGHRPLHQPCQGLRATRKLRAYIDILLTTYMVLGLYVLNCLTVLTMVKLTLPDTRHFVVSLHNYETTAIAVLLGME